MPGQAKTDSTMTSPLKSDPATSPTTVIVGRAAFGRTWR